jgi:hypothetical protein
MGDNVMKPVFNLEPKYSVTMLTREKWTRGPGTPPAVKGLIWFKDGSRTVEGTGVWGLWALWEEGSASLKENILQSFKLNYT